MADSRSGVQNFVVTVRFSMCAQPHVGPGSGSPFRRAELSLSSSEDLSSRTRVAGPAVLLSFVLCAFGGDVFLLLYGSARTNGPKVRERVCGSCGYRWSLCFRKDGFHSQRWHLGGRFFLHDAPH